MIPSVSVVVGYGRGGRREGQLASCVRRDLGREDTVLYCTTPFCFNFYFYFYFLIYFGSPMEAFW